MPRLVVYQMTVYESRLVMVNCAAVMGGQLTAHEIVVYVVLCGYASSTGKSCFPSYSTLGTKAAKKAEIDAKRAALRAEDMTTGVYIPVGNLPLREAKTLLIKTFS